MSDNQLFDGTLSVTIGGYTVPQVDVLGPPAAPGRTYSNTNPGGFGEHSFRLRATSPWEPYHAAVVKGAAVELKHGATVLFQGEVTNDVSHAVIEDGTAFYDVTAAGLWWKAGQRKDFCRVWADDDYGQWFELNSGGPFQVDTDGKLDIRLEADQKAKSGSSKSLYYWLEGGMGDPDDYLLYLVGVVEGNVNDKDTALWHADISYADSPWSSWEVWQSWDNEGIAAGTPLYVVLPYSAVPRALRLRLRVSNATSTDTTADRYIMLTRMSSITASNAASKVIDSVTTGDPALVNTSGSHGIKTGDRVFIANVTSTPSIEGWQTASYVDADTFSVPVDVSSYTPGAPGTERVLVCRCVDVAMADIAVATGLATSSDLQAGGIGNVSWGLNVRPHMSRAEAIETLAANHVEPIDYGFWDDATFYCKERSAPADWYIVDASDPGIDWAVFADTEASPTHVKVVYTFRDQDGGTSPYPDGTIRAVYRPSEPTWGDASVVLDVWDEWSDLVLEEHQAEALGDQILAWIANNQYVGSCSVATPTVAMYGGVPRIAAYMRAGEYIAEVNMWAAFAMPPQMITSVSVDVDAGVTTLGIGETRADFVRRVTERIPARRSPGQHRKLPKYKPAKW